MTTKSNKPADKTTTFGDEKPVGDETTETTETTETIEETKTGPNPEGSGVVSPEQEEKANEAKAAKADPKSWDDVEAEVRAEFEGHLFGRRLEEAVYHVEKGFKLAGGK